MGMIHEIIAAGAGRHRLRRAIHRRLSTNSPRAPRTTRPNGSRRSPASPPTTSASSPTSTPPRQPAAIRQGVALERSRGGGQAIRAITCLPALVGAWRHVGGGTMEMPIWEFPTRFDAICMTGVDSGGHPGGQRARPGHGAHRRDGARPADQVAVRLQLQPGVAGPSAGEDDAWPDARRPVHRRQRALHHRHSEIRRSAAAGHHAGRAARHHGDLGSPVHLTEPAGDRAARGVRAQRRAVPAAGQDDGVRRTTTGTAPIGRC